MRRERGTGGPAWSPAGGSGPAAAPGRPFGVRGPFPARPASRRRPVFLPLPFRAQADLSSSPTEDQCSTCLCSFRSTFIDQVDASKYENVTRAEAESILQSCISVVYQPMTAAGVDINSLLSLTACTEVPSCFTA